MTEINTHQEDLLFLTRNVRGALQNLASTVPKPSKDKQAVDSSAKQCLKNIELLSGNI